MDVAMQGGGPNYLGEQPMVNAPKYWQSSPDHEPAELAYITDKEKDILIDLDIYGSLQGSPNRGPSGIMSLQGDLGGYDASPGGPDSESGDGSGGRNDKARAAAIMTGRVNVSSPTGMTQGYTGPEGVRDSFGNYVGGKYVGNRGFLGNLFSGANKYGYRDVYTSGAKQGQTKPGYFGRFLGGLGSMITGIPFVGSALGSAYDYGKGIFNIGPKDMSQFNALGLYDDRMRQKAFYDDALYSDNYSDMKISDTSFKQSDTSSMSLDEAIDEWSSKGIHAYDSFDEFLAETGYWDK
jgi:hypothetical protein